MRKSVMRTMLAMVLLVTGSAMQAHAKNSLPHLFLLSAVGCK
jgi:hypothetical protein